MEERNKHEGSGEKKPFRKRQLNLKRTVSAVYLGLALCMVVVLAISFTTTKNKVQGDLDKLDDISVSLPDISMPDLSAPDDFKPNPPVNDHKPDDNPVGGTQDNVQDVITEPDDTSVEVTKPLYIKPVTGEILKEHSTDKLVFSQTMQDFRVHKGIDITADIGSKVCAYTDGKVIKVENLPLMGTTVEIEHEAGVRSVYSNLDKTVSVAVGDTVLAGDVIGTIGNTAIVEAADAPHLHFEIWMGEDCLNPIDQFPN